jgi:proteasome alpha subunit
MPFYVSPEQLMKDRADFARKGIARGRPVIVVTSTDGICFVSENPSNALHKISEIYDRIAFAAVGKYNEFENLRVAGVRYADLRGYSYDRTDVTARGLANAYAQTLGAVFTQESKPYEVEIVVAEVAATQDGDQLYRLTYDGSVADERGFVAMGASAEQITEYLRGAWRPGLSSSDALRLAVGALRGEGQTTPAAGEVPGGLGGGSLGGGGAVGGASGGNGAGRAGARDVPVASIEAAVLDRHVPRRAFRRLDVPELESVLA